MNTVLTSTNTRGNSQGRPSHPVDAALWGLAERLAGGAEATAVEVEATPGSMFAENGATERQPSQMRVVGLPPRAGGLPSTSRLARRREKNSITTRGVPTKPASQKSPGAKAAAPGESRSAEPETVSEPKLRCAQFTILKDRKNVATESGAGLGEELQGGQDSASVRESSERTSKRSSRRKRRAKAGVSIYGWLLLAAVSMAAAAIALFAPAWF